MVLHLETPEDFAAVALSASETLRELAAAIQAETGIDWESPRARRGLLHVAVLVQDLELALFEGCARAGVEHLVFERELDPDHQLQAANDP